MECRFPPCTTRTKAAQLRAAFCLVASLLVAPSLFAATYYVATTGDDSRTSAEAQNPATPWRSITHALNVAISGDFINVAAGTYVQGSPGETYPLQMKSGVQMIGAGAATTILQPPAGVTALVGSGGMNSNTLFRGFTVTTGGAYAGISIVVGSESFSPNIQNSIFDGNGDSAYGIVIASTAPGGSFTGTISGNTFREFGSGIDEGPPSTYFSGVAILASSAAGDTLSPTITNNTFTDNKAGVSAVELASASATTGIIAPTITSNTFSGNEFDQYFSYQGSAVATFAPNVTGNQSTGALFGTLFFPLSFSAPSGLSSASERDFRLLMKRWEAKRARSFDLSRIPPDVRPMFEASARAREELATSEKATALATINAFRPTLSTNQVTISDGEAALLMYQTFAPAESLDMDITITGNVVSGGGMLIQIEAPAETTEVADTVIFQGNTISGGDGGFYPLAGNVLHIQGGGVPIPAKQASAVANQVLISNNVIQNMTTTGLLLESSGYTTRAFQVECNTITGNSGDGVVQISQSDPSADLGGGSSGSTGRNNIHANGGGTPGFYDLLNEDADAMSALGNYWGATTGPTIDARIGDDEETLGGAVDFSNFLSAPAICYPDADLQITKSGTASVATSGQITYTLTIRNNGPGFAAGLEVLDQLPAGTTFVSASAGCSLQPGNIVRCLPGSLSSGAQGALTITATAPSSIGVITNTATISSAQVTETNTANNSSSFDTSVSATATADLSIAKSAFPATVAPGGQVVYTLTVINNGPGTATNVAISDPLPAGSTFVSASAGCTFASGVVTCAIGALAPLAQEIRTITTLAPTVVGQFSNTATVSATESDPTPANNTGSGTAAVAEVAAVPTLSEWASILLGLLLLASGGWLIGRRGGV